MLEKAIIIVGLPGSGKSKLGNQLIEEVEDSVFYDEVMDNPEEQESLRKACDEYSTIILSSPFLCVAEARENAKNFFKAINKKVKLEWKYFDYNLKACIENRPDIRSLICRCAEYYTIPNRTKKIQVEPYD